MATLLNDKALGAYYPLALGDGAKTAIVSGSPYKFPKHQFLPADYDLLDWSGQHDLFTTARTNQIASSQNFGSWTPSNTGTGVLPVVTVNDAIAPDGTPTAAKLVMDIAAGTLSTDLSRLGSLVSVAALTGNHVGSVWMKTSDGTTQTIELNLSGVVPVLCTVTPFWQRFTTAPWNAPGAVAGIRVQLRGNFGTSKSASIHVWGGQVEAGVVATGYIPTTAAAVTVTDFSFANNILTLAQTTNPAAKQPVATNGGKGDGVTTAFTVTPSGTTPTLTALYKRDWQGTNLLYTTPRKNEVQQSQTLGDAAWTKSSVGITADAITAPDGTLTADKIIEAAASARHELQSTNTTIPITTQTTMSVYAKAGERQYLYLSPSGTSALSATFDLLSGTVANTGGSCTASIQSFGNGWYRCKITYTSTAANAALWCCVRATAGLGVETYLGDGTSGLYCWGGQAELGAVATSYIPTTTAVTVTDYSLATNTATLSPAPAVGSTILWDGSYVGGLTYNALIFERLFSATGVVL